MNREEKHLGVCKQEDIKTKNEVISLVNKNGQQQGEIVLIPIPDANTGNYKGIPFDWEERRKRGENVETPDSVFRVKAGVGAEFNLNSQKIANIWNWVQYSPWVAASKQELQYKPEALLYPDEPDKELEAKDKLRDIKYEIESWIRNSSETERISISRFLGRKVQDVKPIEIKNYLIDLVKTDKYKDLQKIKEEFSTGDYKYKAFLFKLEDLRICTKYKVTGLKFEDEILGDNLDECIKWIKDPAHKEELLILQSRLKNGNSNFEKEDELRLEELKSTIFNIKSDIDKLNNVGKEETIIIKD